MKNKYKVQKKQWAKWPEPAQDVFNSLFYTMMANPHLFQHPGAAISQTHWVTTAWNAAWMAADYVRDYVREQERG